MKNRIGGLPLGLLLIATMTDCTTTRSVTTEATRHDDRHRTTQREEARESVSHHTADRLRQEERTDTTTIRLFRSEPVAAERSEMTIPIRSLLELPEGAKYSAREGRASVEAERRGDGIVIRGACDSIARRSIRIERQVARQRSTTDTLRQHRVEAARRQQRTDSLARSETESLRQEEQRKRPAARPLGWLFAGVLAGATAAVLLRRYSPLKALVSRLTTGGR